MSLSADRLRRLVPAAAVLGLALGLAGCSSDGYGDNRDSVSLQFGDAVAANKTAQTIDPWPPQVANTRLDHSGVRTAAAVERYHKGMILPPVPATTSAIPTPAAAPGAGATAR